MTLVFRARVPAIRIAAIERLHLARPSGRLIAEQVGLAPKTVHATFRGRPPTAQTIAAFVSVLGGHVDDWFEIIDSTTDERTAEYATRQDPSNVPTPG